MMTKKELLRNLKYIKIKEEGKTYFVGELNVYEMVCDVIDYLENSKLDKENDRLQSQLLEYQRVCKQKQEIIDELQANPPLKFEELKEGMWVWDNKEKEYLYIRHVNIGKFSGIKYFAYLGIYRNLREFKDLDMIFEENRFYRKEAD